VVSLFRSFVINDKLPSLNLARPGLLCVPEGIELLARPESDDSVEMGICELEEEARCETKGTKGNLSFNVCIWVEVRGRGRVNNVLNDLGR